MSSITATGETSWAALFRLSLRELLLLIAMVALAIASMKYASTAWRTCVYTITMAIFMWAAVIAVIDRGQRQAYAIGIVIFMVIYGALVTNVATSRAEGNREMDPRSGRLPTSRIVKYLFPPTETIQWFDGQTGELLANYDPVNAPPGTQAFRRTHRTPDPPTLMAIGHCWWALLLGYIGGRFARVVYLRRNDRPTSPS